MSTRSSSRSRGFVQHEDIFGAPAARRRSKASNPSRSSHSIRSYGPRSRAPSTTSSAAPRPSHSYPSPPAAAFPARPQHESMQRSLAQAQATQRRLASPPPPKPSWTQRLRSALRAAVELLEDGADGLAGAPPRRPAARPDISWPVGVAALDSSRRQRRDAAGPHRAASARSYLRPRAPDARTDQDRPAWPAPLAVPPRNPYRRPQAAAPSHGAPDGGEGSACEVCGRGGARLCVTCEDLGCGADEPAPPMRARMSRPPSGFQAAQGPRAAASPQLSRRGRGRADAAARFGVARNPFAGQDAGACGEPGDARRRPALRVRTERLGLSTAVEPESPSSVYSRTTGGDRRSGASERGVSAYGALQWRLLMGEAPASERR